MKITLFGYDLIIQKHLPGEVLALALVKKHLKTDGRNYWQAPEWEQNPKLWRSISQKIDAIKFLRMNKEASNLLYKAGVFTGTVPEKAPFCGLVEAKLWLDKQDPRDWMAAVEDENA